MKINKYKIRRFGEELWSEVEGRNLYEVAETYCEQDDEEGKVFRDEGIVYEIRDMSGDKIDKVKITASVSYNAVDAEET